jgi:hypothetical protein
MAPTRMSRAMLFGYSLIIDEYVDANRLKPTDCDLLKVRCAVCTKPVTLIVEDGHISLAHIQAVFDDPACQCESHLCDFTSDYREHQNARARSKRLETIRWDLLIELLKKDPLARFEDHAEVVLGKLRSRGAMRWLIQWHLEMAVDVCRSTPDDEIEFRSDGENHLAKFGADHIDIPSSGYARQVHFEIAYQLMQYVLSRKGSADDDYGWLFTHALKLCLSHWTTEARLDGNESEEYPSHIEATARERIAAARIVIGCFCDFLLDDKKKHLKAIKTLAELEIKPPLAPIAMPLVSFVGIEILSAMKTTLFRLPYLSMLSEFDRPCRPAVA